MSGGYEYRDARRGGRSKGVGTGRQSRSPELVMRAAQALAGNGAVSASLAPEAADLRKRPGYVGEGRVLQVAPPALEVQLAHRTFERFIATQRTRSVRTLTAALAGQRGYLATDWNAGTGSSAVRQRSHYRAGRRRFTISGELEDFAAVSWLDPLLDDPSAVDDVDLRSLAPSSGSVQSNLRVRMGRFDLVSAKAPMEVSLDGEGTVTLACDHPRGSLKLVGRDRGDRSGSLDWEYELEVSTAAVARAALHHAPRAASEERTEDAASNEEIDDMTAPEDTPSQPVEDNDVRPGDRAQDLLAAAEGLGSEGQGTRGQASTVRRPRRVVRGAPETGLLDDASEPERVRVRSTTEEVPKGGFVVAPSTEDDEEEKVMLDASGQVIASAVGASGAERGAGRRDSSVYLADAVRAYLDGVDEHGQDHPVTADRLNRLRRNLDLYDREA